MVERSSQVCLEKFFEWFDLRQAVDKMTLDMSLSIYTPIWVCTFAICQCFGSRELDDAVRKLLRPLEWPKRDGHNVRSQKK